MTIPSRWTVPVPACSLQQWIFGSATGPVSDAPAFLDADRPDTHFLTVAQYRLLSKRVALGLRAAGLAPGDRVLLFSGNNLFFPCVFLGVLMAGGIFTGANPTFVPRELAHQLRDSGARFMVAADGPPLETALAAAAEVGLPRDHVFVLAYGSDDKDAPEPPRPSHVAEDPDPTRTLTLNSGGPRHWTELLVGNSDRARSWSWEEPSDPASTTCCLNYSSGTTGVPKGVEISHRSYVANGEGVLYTARLDPDYEAARRRSRALCFLPMYHAMAQTYFVANYPRQGTPVYMLRRFDFSRVLECLQRFRITLLTAVPPILVALAKSPLTRRYDLSAIEAVGCGAAPLSSEVSAEVERLWPREKGLFVRQGWGMTEVTCTCLSWDPLARAASSSGVGEPMPNCAARLVRLDSPDENQPVLITEPDVRGELWVTGPTLMRGYWRNPRATAEAVWTDPSDGTRWLRTGDIAYVEGPRYGPGSIFHIVDRKKELIKVKGNQVAPAELEGVLLDRPDVTDACVVGVVVGGEEVPRAYVVLAGGGGEKVDRAAKEREIVAWMAERVARFKQLRGGVGFVDAIPKNPSGKILRKLVRELAKKEVGDRSAAKL